jgi:phosphate transport system protein
MTFALADPSPTAFDIARQELTGMVAEMGGHTEKLRVEAVEALSKGDPNHSKRIISADATVDSMQHRIEQKAIDIFGLRRSGAEDVRDIVGIIRIANDLERIGDRAKNIAKRVIGLSGEIVSRRLVRGVEHMAAVVLHQLRRVLDAFTARDSAEAFDVWVRDHEIDTLNSSLFREVMADMAEDPRAMTYGVHMLFCAKNIERIGDHVTNIAEAVFFMVEGRMLLNDRPKADVTSLMSPPAGC